MVSAGQLHIPLRLHQGTVSQPLPEDRRGNPVEDGIPPVGVPEGMVMGPCPGSNPVSTADSFILLLTRCRLMSKRGFCGLRGD